MKGELKQIKKLYGENFAKMCRDFFPVVLCNEGQLTEVLTSLFYPSHMLYDDIKEQGLVQQFKDYVYSKVLKVEHKNEDVAETPEELMDKVGYILTRCETNEDIAKFEKYYKPGEQLCTFKVSNRINTHEIFFAVKKNVDKIKREDFEKPKRQDEYGTSVLSIQFANKNNYLSIKNRYNHTVQNCDATFNNNLDNICYGLADSFAKYYGLKTEKNNTGFELEQYIRDENGRLIKYNYEIDNIKYCPDNIVVYGDGRVQQYNKCIYELIDYFLINKRTKDIVSLRGDDSFLDEFFGVKNIDIRHNPQNNGRDIIVTKPNRESFVVELDNRNRIVGYYNESVEEIGNDFLYHNNSLEKFYAPKLKSIKSRFMPKNMVLQNIIMPEIRQIGNCFLELNDVIRNVYFPKLESIGDFFFQNNTIIEGVNLPSLQRIGNSFLYNNIRLQEMSLPKIKTIGDNFLGTNKFLREFSAPNLEMVGDCFLSQNLAMRTLVLPKIKMVGSYFLGSNNSISSLEMPEIQSISYNFMNRNNKISQLNFPNIAYIRMDFMPSNDRLQSFVAPNLTSVENSFLSVNTCLKYFDMSNLRVWGESFLKKHPKRQEIINKLQHNVQNEAIKTYEGMEF